MRETRKIDDWRVDHLFQFPDGEIIVGISRFEDKIIIATTHGLYEAIGDKICGILISKISHEPQYGNDRMPGHGGNMGIEANGPHTLATTWQATSPPRDRMILVRTSLGIISAQWFDGEFTRSEWEDEYSPPVFSAYDDAVTIECSYNEDKTYSFPDILEWMDIPK